MNENGFDDTVVQPDVLVVCDKNKITKRGCEGLPDLVIEIVSPTSGQRDRLIKLKRYQQAGIKEYWIVDLEARVVHVHILSGGKYTVYPYGGDEKIAVYVLPGCEIDFTDVFVASEEG